ncbi:MAG: DUF3500 domain-containing protein [Holophagales bacterium]|nr:DUF3500 domain-containing protein [Holophagales bacterium]MYH25224.1 DUF3500 domain-containing protein [Holophagales bacterium]
MLRHLLAVTLALLTAGAALAQRPGDRMRERSRQIDARLADDPYVGIHGSSGIQRGLYRIESTGVSTEPVREAAEKFLAVLTAEQRAKTTFAVDDDEWRKWMNQHFYVRQGVGFDEMDEAQREAAFGLMRASLSADGLKLSRDIMNLNRTLGELNGDNFAEYNEWLYWITVMGEPSADQPWGWQVDGHHLIINYFVLGDQVVMTPLFVGSEPVIAESGKFKGTAIMQREQDQGLALIRSLPAEQQTKAIIETSKAGNDNLGEAFSDNIVLDYAGIAASKLSPDARARLLDLIGLYVHNLREGHARVRMAEVEAHLDETHFAWIGATDEDAVFYYRIHSPVILIEFDHQRPVGIRHLVEGRAPIRQHIHAVVRTPNGNDYGKDLLRQHYERDH